jgi:hypothetical protein
MLMKQQRLEKIILNHVLLHAKENQYQKKINRRLLKNGVQMKCVYNKVLE